MNNKAQLFEQLKKNSPPFKGSPIIKIDTSKWVTPTQYAKLKDVSIQVVQNWMARNKIEVWKIPELNIKLIRV